MHLTYHRKNVQWTGEMCTASPTTMPCLLLLLSLLPGSQIKPLMHMVKTFPLIFAE